MTDVSAVLITQDAAEHLDRVLSALKWCAEIIIVDSGSTDETLAIADRHGARVIHQDWLGFGPQKRFAVEQARHDWIVSVDADEVLDASSIAALEAMPLDDAQVGYRIARSTYIAGKRLRFGHWHPDRVLRLFNRKTTNFTMDLVHESVVRPAVVDDLPGCLHHYSYLDLASVFRGDYHRIKAQGYREKGRRAGTCLLLARGAWAFLRSFIFKQGFRDGQAGLVVALSAAVNAVLGLAMASWQPEPPASV